MAAQAKYYIYRNLHTGTFSLKYKGKVILHPDCILLNKPEFKVSEKGRQRVLKEKRKNVHATVSGTSYLIGSKIEKIFKDNINELTEVIYDPYKMDSFIIKDTNKKIAEYYNPVLLYKNRIYLT
jgi:hypothetical protein